MAIRIPYGIDPDEIWDLDFCAEVARGRARLESAVAKTLRESAETKAPDAKAALEAQAALAEKRAAEAEADLTGYEAGSGPIFKVGSIPGRRRAELTGRHQELAALDDGKEKAVGLAEWSRDVAAAAVKSHRNLRTAGGREVTFDLTDGRPSERTLEAYAPILADLAWIVLAQQRLGPDGKNG